jgi:hypothetical protein
MLHGRFLGLTLALAAAAIIGCGPKADQKADKKTDVGKSDSKKDIHDHEHGDGPHGGAIAEWGDGNYHVEFTVDHDLQQSTVYVLGSDAKSAAPVKAESLLLSINEPAFQVTLEAQPLEGESAGASSRFVGKHESLGIVREFAGTISGEIDGKPFAGEFEEKP